MGFGIIDTSTLTAIANAIRSKLGVQTTYKPSEMATAIGQISSGGITPTGTKEITANGTNIDVASYAYADVAVPNSYSQSDEGKVVSNGALVAQSSDSVTQNGTVDTTLINSLTVNVSGGGSSGLVYETGTYTAASDGNPTINFTNAHTSAPALMIFMDTGAYVNQISGIAYAYIGFDALFGSGLNVSASAERPAMFEYGRIASNGTTSFGGKAIGTVSDHVTNTGFTPSFDSSSYTCKSGRTYKWIAIWK